jgi:hypothetical protein
MKSILDDVDIGRKEGASLVTGVERVGKRGSFISPAVFADVKHETRVSQEARRFTPEGLCLRGPFAGRWPRSFRSFDLSLPSSMWICDLGEIADIEPSRTDRALFKVIGLDLSDAVAIGRREDRRQASLGGGNSFDEMRDGLAEGRQLGAHRAARSVRENGSPRTRRNLCRRCRTAEYG